MNKPLSPDGQVQFLKGVGPARARALTRLGVETIGDLLRHYPRAYLDRSRVTPIARALPGEEVTIQAEVLTAGERRARGGRSLQTVSVGDSSGVLFIQWFGQSFLLKQLRSGTRILASGVLQLYNGRKQLVHPDFEVLDGESDLLHTGRLVPVYPLTSGIGQHWLRRLVHETLEHIVETIGDPLPADLRARRELVPLATALRSIHFPEHAAARDAARRRLVYEELFLIQLAMLRRRVDRSGRHGPQLAAPGDLTTRLVTDLPFALTGAQRRVLGEILRDLRGGGAMHRLLQGDVGSGKTLVALIAACFVIEQGWQSVLVAPTEVLARQHGATLRRLTDPLGLSVETLTGATPAAERRAILRGLSAGEIDLLVGTHAVLQDDVEPRRLGLAIVDEQHRFGVRQRWRAGRGGEAEILPHVLVMSATPIPRSLALTLYGDLDLSIIDELPAGRQPIVTELSERPAAELYVRIERELAAGRQAYVIHPVISETEGQDLKAAEAGHAALCAGPFAHRRVGLLHGRLKPAEKQSVMAAFAAGELDLLVATTVVEVGVDVPNATFLLIHNPERFGLAQLHQLRGRIGRGRHASTCVLAVDGFLAPETRERLEFFAATADGFRLAEEDLRRRGPGDVLGVRQHGDPVFVLANPLSDAATLEVCRSDADALLAADPSLSAGRHAALSRALEAGHGRFLALAGAG